MVTNLLFWMYRNYCWKIVLLPLQSLLSDIVGRNNLKSMVFVRT